MARRNQRSPARRVRASESSQNNSTRKAPYTKTWHSLTADAKEALLTQAINELMVEPSISGELNKKAVEHGIPYTTLRNRFFGITKSRKYAYQDQQLLSPPQEDAILEWLKFRADTGAPFSKRGMKRQVKSLCGTKPGKNWIAGFLRRHKDKIKLGKPSGLDPKRAQAFNKPTVMDYFDLLESHVNRIPGGIPARNRYNGDEKAGKLGGGKKGSHKKYFVPRDRRVRYRKRSANLELVTILECVSADGTALEPGFIFAGKEFDPDWFLEDRPQICVSTSPNGWTDDWLGREWFEKCFIPQAKARNITNDPILLILDGHGSHETLEWAILGIEHNIHILFLPSHTTHKLQPLDVGVFGPLERAWADHCDEWNDLYGSDMPKSVFVREYMKIRDDSFKESTIKAAWRKSGAYPLNRDIFTDADYAPSLLYSNSEHTTFAPTLSCPPLERPPHLRNLPNADYASESDSDSDDSDDSDSDSDNSDDDNDTTGSENAVGPIQRRTSLAPPASVDPPAQSPATTPTLLPVHPPPSQPPLPPSSQSEMSPHPPAHSIPTVPLPLAPPLPPPLLAPIPPSQFYGVPPGTKGSRSSKKRKFAATMDYVTSLESRNKYLETQLLLHRDSVADAHLKLNARANQPSKRRKFTSKARTLTGPEGVRAAKERDAEREAKQAKKAEAARKKADEAVRREMLRLERGPDAPFQGSLSSKKKPDLEDLAIALRLDKNGTREELITRIKDHFAAHPELQTSPRYEGIFARGRRPQATSMPHQQASTSQALPIPGPSSAPLTPLTNYPLPLPLNHVPSGPFTFEFHPSSSFNPFASTQSYSTNNTLHYSLPAYFTQYPTS